MKRTVNLIPEEYYVRRRLRLRLAAWGAAFLVLCPALLGLGLWEKARCGRLERRIEQLQTQNAQRQQMAQRLERLRSVRDNLKAKHTAISALLGQNNILILAELDRCLERGIWVTSVEITGAGESGSERPAAGGAGHEAAKGEQGSRASFRMRGYAPSHGVLARMLPRLAELPTLRQPRLIFTKAVAVGRQPAVEFEIEAELECGLTQGAST